MMFDGDNDDGNDGDDDVLALIEENKSLPLLIFPPATRIVLNGCFV